MLPAHPSLLMIKVKTRQEKNHLREAFNESVATPEHNIEEYLSADSKSEPNSILT
jgi:hypothetical protein